MRSTRGEVERLKTVLAAVQGERNKLREQCAALKADIQQVDSERERERGPERVRARARERERQSERTTRGAGVEPEIVWMACGGSSRQEDAAWCGRGVLSVNLVVRPGRQVVEKRNTTETLQSAVTQLHAQQQVVCVRTCVCVCVCVCVRARARMRTCVRASLICTRSSRSG